MNSRPLKPLQKIDNQYIECTFADTYEKIAVQMEATSPESTLFLVGGGLSNEEMYLIQRLARGGVKSNALASFEYLGRGDDFNFDKNDIVPYAELAVSSHFFIFAFDDDNNHPEFCKIKAIAREQQIPCTYTNSFFLSAQVDYYALFRAMNHYLIKHDKAKGIFINGIGKNYAPYQEALMKEDYAKLLAQANSTEEELIRFTETILREDTPVLAFRERDFSSRAIKEMINFAMLIEIQTKTGSGLIGIKESINSQGLFDMGVFPTLCPGGETWNEEHEKLAESLWQTSMVCAPTDVYRNLQQGKYQNILLFGNKGIPDTFQSLIQAIPFKVNHTTRIEKTDTWADIILPASELEETGGSYTDSTRMAHSVAPTQTCPIALNNLSQFSLLGERFGLPKLDNKDDIFLEYVSFFHAGCKSASRHFFTI